jgi:hypothetical protein
LVPGLVNIEKAIETGPVEIADLPIENGVPSFFVGLPEGKPNHPALVLVCFERSPAKGKNQSMSYGLSGPRIILTSNTCPVLELFRK